MSDPTQTDPTPERTGFIATVAGKFKTLSLPQRITLATVAVLAVGGVIAAALVAALPSQGSTQADSSDTAVVASESASPEETEPESTDGQSEEAAADQSTDAAATDAGAAAQSSADSSKSATGSSGSTGSSSKSSNSSSGGSSTGSSKSQSSGSSSSGSSSGSSSSGSSSSGSSSSGSTSGGSSSGGSSSSGSSSGSSSSGSSVLEQYGRSTSQSLGTINSFRAKNGKSAFKSYSSCASPVLAASASGTSLDGLGGSAQHTNVTLINNGLAATYSAIDAGFGTLNVYHCN